jgi:hypothetical protein
LLLSFSIEKKIIIRNAKDNSEEESLGRAQKMHEDERKTQEIAIISGIYNV